MFTSVVINVILIKKTLPVDIKGKWLKMYKYLLAFMLMYLLLLPLGGYRDYRPNVLRYDTMMPVTLTCIMILTSSVILLLKYLKRPYWYYGYVLGVLLIFAIADKPVPDDNLCEKEALYEIAQSEEEFVELHCDCTVMSWTKEFTFKDASMNSDLLVLWNITDEKKSFCNK